MFEIQAAPGGVGAFVHGIDIRSDVNGNVAGELKQALGDYGVLFFRDQEISEQDHIAFAEQFGQINVNRFFAANDRFPQIAMVVKEPDQTGNIGGGWHTDHSYDQEPALGSILVAREVPERGGDTLYANMYAAYDALSDGLKETLNGLRALHSSRRAFGANTEYAPRKDGRIGNPELATQDSIHPVVITHPISGRKALYVNGGFTIRFDGWTEDESKPLLQYLYAHASRPEFTYRFKWEKGSIAFWDNRATWHYAVNDYHGSRRVMHRITVEGCALSA
ncbi:MAG: TauD/TfdA dioxygenase family protein [Minwuia sp.]|uniref:TauD/TfdA dioxygenase family protein n=1 Tax=Minwuia sp. TaxID=2493630 RepID=UPI003A8BCBED